MKSPVTILVTASLIVLPGCMKPVRIDPLVEIETNETAFLIPLEGATSDQQQFDSIEYLEQRKVATKRIIIPQRDRKIGRGWWNYEWVPTVRVVTVDRTPVTREWTQDSDVKSGGSAASAIEVESKDSIGFLIGVNVTAYIEEVDTATFLYYYRSQPLDHVIDNNVRGVIQTQLSEQFATYNLKDAIGVKNEIMENVRTFVVPYFKKFGITIPAMGIAEGLTFVDQEIQDAINAAYVAEQNILRATNEAVSQRQTNERLLSIAQNERAMAEEFAKAAEARKKQVEVDNSAKFADAVLALAQSWDGKSWPYFLSMSDGISPNMLFTAPEPGAP